MTRRAIFVFLLSILMLISGVGFFINNRISAAENQLFLNSGDVTTASWQCFDCLQKENGGNNFIVASSSQFQLISPELDLSEYVSTTFYFKGRTYYGTTTEHYRIDLYVSTDGGLNWLLKESFYPSTNNFTNIFYYSLVDFNDSKIIIKLTAPGVSGRNSIGLDDLFFQAILPTVNQAPTAIASLSTTTTIVGEEIFFDGSDSYDNDGSIADWVWDLAGELIHSSTTSKIFNNIGDKTIYFWAVDNDGASSSLAFNLSITNPMTTSTTTTTSTTIINPNDLLINEIYPAPPTGETEWLEIYNNTTSTIDLSELYLLDAKFSTTTLSGSINSGSYLIVENISGNLNNDGDTIILRSKDSIISQITYGDFSNRKDQSWARDLSGQYWSTIKITKGAANIIEAKPITTSGVTGGVSDVTINKVTASTTSTTTQATSSMAINYQGKIIINEVYPNPNGADDEEFIELKNTSDQDIELNGFYLADNTNRKHLMKSPDKLIALAGGLVIIKRASSSIALNNSGFEAINLYDPEGDLIDRVTYEAEKSEGGVYARNDSGEWLWSLSPTPGEENIFDNSQELIAAVTTIVNKAKSNTKKLIANYGLVELDKINELADSSKVIIRGIVSVEPGLLGSQVFYIAGSGIQVYCYKKDFPNLKIGDYIEITGELSTASTGRRIKIKTQNDIKILDHREPPQPHNLLIGEINEDYENNLVKTEGEIIQIKGRSVFIDNGEDELEVYVKSSINFKDLNLKEGDKLSIIGIIIKGGSSHRLLPRTLTDFSISRGQVMGEFEGIANKSKINPLVYYLSAVIVFLIGLVIVLYLRLTKKLYKIKNPQ